MCRISTVSNDWVVKGFHIHVDGIELAMRPDHSGGIVFRKVFRSTSDTDASRATKIAASLLDDPTWRRRFRAAIERGMEFLLGVEGDYHDLARGRTCELHYLKIALDRLEMA
jgi:hypothetical protein